MVQIEEFNLVFQSEKISSDLSKRKRLNYAEVGTDTTKTGERKVEVVGICLFTGFLLIYFTLYAMRIFILRRKRNGKGQYNYQYLSSMAKQPRIMFPQDYPLEIHEWTATHARHGPTNSMILCNC